jgi:hypothetical protein
MLLLLLLFSLFSDVIATNISCTQRSICRCLRISAQLHMLPLPSPSCCSCNRSPQARGD